MEYYDLNYRTNPEDKKRLYSNAPWFYESSNGKMLIRSLVYRVYINPTNPNSKERMVNCILFNKKELSDISNAVSVMEKFFLNSVRFIAVEDAYNEFRDELQKRAHLGSTLTIGNKVNVPDESVVENGRSIN